MQKIFTPILIIIFTLLISLFTYKTLKTPESSKVSITQTLNSEDNNLKNGITEDKLNKEEFDKKIHDYILNNPEILIESIESLQRKKMEDSNKQTTNYLLENKSTVEEEGSPPVLGNKDGDITIVVFYDYNCSFCKQANQITNELLANDPKIQVILRPLPILGGTSMYATQIALAAHKISEEKFHLIHNEMMKMKPITEEGLKALLLAHDIDYKIVDNEINSFSIKQLIAKNFELAKSLGIKGAPSYVVNGIFIPGLIDKEKFSSIILELRQIAAQTQQVKKPAEDQKSEDVTEKKE
jgi:protein-disulfide isomerase